MYNSSEQPINEQDWLKLRPVEAALLIDKLQEEKKISFLESYPIDYVSKVFKYLPLYRQRSLLTKLHHVRVANILNVMAPDSRTLLLAYLPTKVVKELIQLLSDQERKVALELLGFPILSVGRLMTPDYIAVKENWTISQVLEYVREHGKDSETLHIIYVVDDNGKLIDDINIRDFLLSPKDHKVSDLMDYKYLYLKPIQTQKDAISFCREHHRFALPVIDEQQLLLGIVTIDDILKISREADTEEIQRIGGSEALDEPYMEIPLLRMVRKRAGWLIVLFLGEMLTATAMSFFEDEIAKAVVLALFVPLIISSGGNSGSQATTLIIRAMALGEVKIKDWWKVMRREVQSGLLLGIILGLIGFLRIFIWTLFSKIYGPHWLLVGATVGISLVGVVLWGSLSGSMLPLILRRLGLDPATSSAPFVATLVDVTGLIIYFSVAVSLLKGTLL